MTRDVLQPLALALPAVEQKPRMPAGFRAGAVAAGIKSSGRPDLGVLATTDGRPVAVAATFTRNRLRAAPVVASERSLAASEPAGEGQWGRAAAVVSTSGCANAATGPAGDRDQAALMAALAESLGIGAEHVLALSTGLIGTRLPVEALRHPLAALARGGLAEGDDALAALAEQICTTDTRAKSATARLELPGRDGAARPITVSGVAKGVGMIHPRMATMLAIVLTDASVEPQTLHRLLGGAVESTWNQLTVDGDTSTNDTVFLFASGASGAAPVEPGSPAEALLGGAIEAVARSLARQQAADGEGATTLITCQVSGGRDDVQARAAARAVVGSSLVKAAVHGRDPNWGRVAAAVGNAEVAGRPVAVTVDAMRIAIAGTLVFAGQPVDFDKAAVARLMDAAELLIRVELGAGDGIGEAFGCDLTEAYVVENSAYST